MVTNDLKRDDGDPLNPPNPIPRRSRMKRMRSIAIPLCLLILLNSGLLSVLPRPASAQGGFKTSITGIVLSHSSLSPISGARIQLPEFNLETFSDSFGRFTLGDVIIPDASYQADISVTAEGFGDWNMINVRLLSSDTLILDIKLESSAVTITIPDGTPFERTPEKIPSLSAPLFPSIDQRDAPLLNTIRVRVTGQVGSCNHSLPYTVEVVDFKDYVKHVLPYEWIRDWPRESLRAGAMAAKMYAWQIVADGGRYDDADVYDSICDQVYIPGATYSSTNNAIEFTWNWRLTHPDGSLFRTHYMDWYWRCENLGWQGFCMGQWDTYYHSTGNSGYEKLNWDEMIFEYYWDSELSYVPIQPPAKFKLRFFGNGWGDHDRIKILVDNPSTGGLPVDVGAADMTIEWWMHALTVDNQSPTCSPGGDNWMAGNIIFDRDVPGSGDHGEYGISLTNGTIAFGVNNGTSSETLCGIMDVADGQWHHIAVTRSSSDGQMRIFVDGELDQEMIGPAGDISYRDGRTAQNPDQDPYLVIGARKSDLGLAYNGNIDEIRISNVIRYTEYFQPDQVPFTTDSQTMALYHFDQGYGNTIFDRASAAGGPSHGIRNYGGDPENGPEWQFSLLYLFHQLFMPVAIQ